MWPKPCAPELAAKETAVRRSRLQLNEQNMSLSNITTSPNAITIETPWDGCWRVCINKKPASDWSTRADAEAHARRLGWRGNGEPQGTPSTLVNERQFGNERLSIGPTVRFQ
jgi:DNA-binding transcriptional regulator PaaX